MSQKIELGCYARDVITGFEGVVIAEAHYLTGCDQLCLKPRTLSESGDTKDGRWFDVEQVERVEAEPLVHLPGKQKQEAAGRSGGPRMDAPPRL